MRAAPVDDADLTAVVLAIEANRSDLIRALIKLDCLAARADILLDRRNAKQHP